MCVSPLRCFRSLLLLGLLVSTLEAALRVGTLNCYFLVDPARPPEGRLADKAPPPEVYTVKLDNLSGMLGALDVVALQEVGSGIEATALAQRARMGSRFVQGKDTFTGQDVATLVAERPGLTVRGATRVRELENLSKHLLVTMEEGGTRYAILNVHLLRPFGQNEERHQGQLRAIADWAMQMKISQPGTVVVVLGDFNNPGRGILSLRDSAEANDFAPTHLDQKALDRIFTSGTLGDVEVLRPPYPKRPNDLLKSLWSDHFLVKALVLP
jgi:endonuclease/exonuclease/phosphatase family metal-dependent hydrolase